MINKSVFIRDMYKPEYVANSKSAKYVIGIDLFEESWRVVRVVQVGERLVL